MYKYETLKPITDPADLEGLQQIAVGKDDPTGELQKGLFVGLAKSADGHFFLLIPHTINKSYDSVKAIQVTEESAKQYYSEWPIKKVEYSEAFGK